MPSAPLNSALVSEMAEAAPVRSGGAVVMMISLPSVNTGASARLISTVAAISTCRPKRWSMKPSIRKASAATLRPTIRMRGTERPRASRGASSEPTRKPADHGTVASPACSGDRPSTPCRYCVMKM